MALMVPFVVQIGHNMELEMVHLRAALALSRHYRQSPLVQRLQAVWMG